jgi:hypothetical protein
VAKSSTTRYSGTIEEICSVDATQMADWIKAIPYEEWPQQSKTELKPAMVNDLGWHGFGWKGFDVVYGLGFKATEVHNLLLSVVMPGHSIDPHRDGQDNKWLYRVHVPLLTNDKAVTIMGDIRHKMAIGKAYKMNTMRTHAVENCGDTPRVHFMFDIWS